MCGPRVSGTPEVHLLFLLTNFAVAGVPDTVRPIAAPADAVEAYRAWATREGRPDALVCETLVEEVLVCFTVDDGKTRQWVGESLLLDWETDRPTFFATMRERAGEHVAVEAEEADGISYWLHGSEDRWSAAGLLRPDRLLAVTEQESLHVAAPLETTVIAWTPGDDELDQIMAVGVAEMVASQPKAVSPVVLAWDGKAWSVYGEAIAAPKTSPKAPPPPR